MGLLLVGFIVIGAVLVYRATRDGGPATRYAAERLELPAGAEVISTTLADGAIGVTYRTATGAAIRLFDGKTGALLHETAIVLNP